MNKTQLKAAISKYADKAKETTKEELNQVLLADEYSEGDAAQIVTALFPEEEKEVKSESGMPDLSGFDYSNLTGDKFKEYAGIAGDRAISFFNSETGEESKGIIGQLKDHDVYYFELYKVTPVFKVRFPGVQNSPKDFSGVKTKTDRPESTTRITVKIANELNAQIENEHSRVNGKYYLLKKDQ